MNTKKLSFPHLGDYYIPVKYLFNKLTTLIIEPAPPITKKTIDIGFKYSPEFVCIPFKYNLGNLIEALDNGCEILIQAGGGCRYGYYKEVQEEILRSLGYNFEFYSLKEGNTFKIKKLYSMFKKLNPKINPPLFTHYILLTLLMIYYIDKIDDFIRLNIGFEIHEKSFEKLKRKMYKSFTRCNHFSSLTYNYFKYKKKFKNIPINKEINCLKIGIIGELYTSMEPFSSYFLEKELANMNIEIKRFTNVTYLLIKKRFMKKKMLKYVKDYIKYPIGADGLDNVYRTKKLIDQKYDGIIHIKPSGCTPEIGAMQIIKNICNDYKMPILFLSFDNQTSIEGIKTRIEAFYDMLNMKKGKKNE